MIGVELVLGQVCAEISWRRRDLRRASTWGDRLRYLFVAPGWSHDGPHKRARVLRRRQVQVTA